MALTAALLGAIPSSLHIVTPLAILRVVSPAIVLLTALCIIPTRPLAPSSPSPITSVVVANRTPRRALILLLLSLASLVFLLDGLTFVVLAVLDKTWPEGTGIEIGAIEGVVAFGGLAALGAWKDVQGVDVWLMKRVKTGITLTLLCEIAQVVFLALGVHKPLAVRSILRILYPALLVLLLLPLLGALSSPRVSYIPVQTADEEAPTDTSLLLPTDATAPSTGLSPLAAEASKYGTFRTTRSAMTTASGPTTRTPTPAPSNVRVPRSKGARTQEKEEVALDPTWGELLTRLRHIAPYLWPSTSRPLQLLAVFCIVLVIIGRVVNFLVPLTFAEIVKIFEEGSNVSPWPYLFVYVALRFLQSSGGIAALRDALWAPVMQYSDREMSLLSFNHLLNLSFAFHTHRKTGEILRILDRGAAINHTFEMILFNIIPTFIDIGVALVFFCVYFEWTLAIVIFAVMAAYVYASVVLTRWRTKLRRQMNERDVVTRGIHTDCLLNYETVKYFGGELHEGERYREAIRQYQTVEFKVLLSLNILNLVQNLIITAGLLVGSMIVALRVTRGQSQTHEFVFFITYLAQLYGPLNMLGYIYRSVNQSLIDTEKLLKLLSEPTEVNDKPGAPDLVVEDGEIEFENVTFSYDGRTTALKGVSFKVPKRSSVALVGESGSGKSTILRLLYRFYDLKEGEGRILVDGKDIRDVTQASLRRAIGVVPQDPVLFNASIGYNIGYGKFGASADEIEAAAKAAQMHDRIVSFPDGYETKVGERGIRLSGGEKQRVAIARTLLKNPPVLLLDEATSALDTSTEKDIQKALQHLVEGRSSLSIAHRLSTIASADVILVLKDGQIVEQGSHTELVAKNGLFASMWADQVSATEDAASVKKGVVTGYIVDEEQSSAQVETDTPEQIMAQAPLVDTPQEQLAELPSNDDVYVPEPSVEALDEGAAKPAAEVAFPSSDAVEETSAPTQDTPVSFPTSVPVSFPTTEAAVVPSSDNAQDPVAFPSSDSAAAPVAFPVSGASLDNTPSVGTQSPGVTFQATPSPARSGTPEVDQDGKRRRTLSTQGIQRLTRRLSVSRQNSSGSPSLPSALLNSFRRGDSSKRDSKDSAREDGSLPTPDNGSLKDGSPANKDSPNTSVTDDINKPKTQKDKKKDKKKEKKRKNTSQA